MLTVAYLCILRTASCCSALEFVNHLHDDICSFKCTILLLNHKLKCANALGQNVSCGMK